MGAVRDFGIEYSLLPNDDESSTRVTLPWAWNGYDSCFINNNGSVTFDGDLRHYTPYSLGDSEFNPHSAMDGLYPYWADVDTRRDPMGIAAVRYGVSEDALYVTWHEVGYYGEVYDQRATFQLVMRRGGSFEFNFDKVQWACGQASVVRTDSGLVYVQALMGWRLNMPILGPGKHVYIHPGSLREVVGDWDANLDVRGVAGHTANTLVDGGLNALTANWLNSDTIGRYIWGSRLAGRFITSHARFDPRSY